MELFSLSSGHTLGAYGHRETPQGKKSHTNAGISQIQTWNLEIYGTVF